MNSHIATRQQGQDAPVIPVDRSSGGVPIEEPIRIPPPIGLSTNGHIVDDRVEDKEAIRDAYVRVNLLMQQAIKDHPDNTTATRTWLQQVDHDDMALLYQEIIWKWAIALTNAGRSNSRGATVAGAMEESKGAAEHPEFMQRRTVLNSPAGALMMAQNVQSAWRNYRPQIRDLLLESFGGKRLADMGPDELLKLSDNKYAPVMKGVADRLTLLRRIAINAKKNGSATIGEESEESLMRSIDQAAKQLPVYMVDSATGEVKIIKKPKSAKKRAKRSRAKK